MVLHSLDRRYTLTFASCFLTDDYWNAASFTTPSSYLHFATFQGETSADISFYFKTSAPYGVFLENLGNTDFIRLELKCKKRLVHNESVSCQVHFIEDLFGLQHTHTDTAWNSIFVRTFVGIMHYRAHNPKPI